jgi:hypothetical protein
MVRLVNQGDNLIKQPSTKYDNRFEEGGTSVPPSLLLAMQQLYKRSKANKLLFSATTAWQLRILMVSNLYFCPRLNKALFYGGCFIGF